jgi:hypothetical protein
LLQCDRGRPHCLACKGICMLIEEYMLNVVIGIKRQTECKYAHVANILE